MAEVIVDQQDKVTEDQENQTVTREQFEELQKQNAEILQQNKEVMEQNTIIKKAQSGSDKTVGELKKLLKQQEEEGKSEEQKMTDRITELEDKNKISEAGKHLAIQESLALKILGEKGEGVEVPKRLDRYLGKDAEETEANMMEYIQDELAKQLKFKDEFARNNGRRVQKAKGAGDMKTQNDYSDDEIDAMSPDEFQKVLDRSREKTTRS